MSQDSEKPDAPKRVTAGVGNPYAFVAVTKLARSIHPYRRQRRRSQNVDDIMRRFGLEPAK